MKKFIKWAAITLVLVVIIAFGVFYAWSSSTFGPSEELQGLIDVESVLKDDAAVFEPKAEERNGVGVILYPGAKVENIAYSYYAKGLMEQGYTVIVPQMLFNFALLSSGKATEMMGNYPEIEQWVIGGHSLGGVAAAMYAADNEMAGLLLLASYPSESSDLSKKAFPVLSLSAEFDGLTLPEDIEETKYLLPEHAVFEEIQGGNHAQFGMYGEQKGDNEASIPAIEQQEQMTELTLRWLKQNNL